MLFNAIVDAAKWLDVLAGRGCKADNEFLLVLPVADQNAFLLVSDRVVKIRSSALATARRLNANNWKAACRTAADYFLIRLPPDVMLLKKGSISSSTFAVLDSSIVGGFSSW